MKVASLGSGSRGNATLVHSRSGGEGTAAGAVTRVMIDCGFSLREVERRAARLAFDLAELDAILVTHEHSDHVSGVAALARRYAVPVFATHGSARAAGLTEQPDLSLQCFDADSLLRIGDLEVDAVAVPHDAREPVQFRLRSSGGCVGVLTDLGCITAHVQRAFADCDLLLLEFNHDPQMLGSGPYPPTLKRRVGGDWGHLANGQAVALLKSMDHQRLQRLVIAHRSDKNNSREHILALLQEELPELLPRLCWAEQDLGFDWLAILPLAGEGKAAAY